MSEPSSLYLRVTLTQEKRDALMASRIALPKDYDDWMPWLATKKMYGSVTANDIKKLGASDTETFGAYINALTREMWTGARAQYDAATQRWTLVVLQLSENYLDFIDALAILRAVARYKDLAGDDFILVYPYIWGNAPDAYVELAQGASKFIAEIPTHAIEEANAGLKALYEQITAGMNFDEV
jgi:hypothetical protein